MSLSDPSRRAFLKTAALTGVAAAAVPAAPPADRPAEPKILNHNPKMGYRRLGKTGIMISEMSLGGHGGHTEQDRRPVLEKAAELGINYIDNNIADECALYGRSLKGLRDRFHIGFASWPEKLTPEYESEVSVDYFLRNIDARLENYATDMLDMWRPVGATWGPGQTKHETMLEVNPRVLDMAVAAFEKARQQGKVRFLGISAHNPKVFTRVLNDYPQFSVILFPYMFLTEPSKGDSLLSLARQKDVGVIAIKPFAAGVAFAGKKMPVEGELDTRAHVLVREMLRETRVSAIIPGALHPGQLEENVKGSYERDTPLTDADRRALREFAANYHAALPPHYQWLRHWETV